MKADNVAALRHAVAVVLAAATPAAAQCVEGWIATDPIDGVYGRIRALTSWTPPGSPEVLVVGGVFDEAGPIAATNIAILNQGQWQPLGSGVDGRINALAVYDGQLIVGGLFSTAGQEPAANIAVWNGAAWSPLGNGTNAEVHALTVHDGELIVAGAFTQAGGTAAQRIAAWNGAAWSPIGGPTGGTIHALTSYVPHLYIGGNFAAFAGAGTANLARWDGSSWGSAGASVSGTVHALHADESGLYAGGQLTIGSSIGIVRLEWGQSAWTGMPGLTTTGSHIVRAIWRHEGELYAAGNFSNFTTGVGGVSRWDGSEWQSLGARPVNDVHALCTLGDDLVVGGSATATSGPGGPTLARWGGSWGSFGSGPNGLIRNLVTFQGTLIASGGFSMAGGELTGAMAQWNGLAWQPFHAQVSGTASAFLQNGDNLLVGGRLIINGQTVFVARLQQDQWSAVGQSFNNDVRALALFNGDLYAGGVFTSVGGQTARAIARFDGFGWQPLQGDLLSSGNPTVTRLQPHNGLLYVAGQFYQAGSVAAAGLVNWNGSVWQAVPSPLPGLLAGMGEHQGALITGAALVNQNTRRISRLAQGTWTNYGPTWLQTGNISQFLSVGDDLYVGGLFAQANVGQGIMRRRNDVWEILDGGVNDNVLALALQDGEIVIGGAFRTAGDQTAGYLARWGCAPPPPCYANCDASTTPPILNVDDFTCFINEFAQAQVLPHAQQLTHYANCDASTIAPVLNVDDFTCFINAFAQGCP